LRAFVAEAQVGRIGRAITGVRDGATWDNSHPARLWVNGDEGSDPNPHYTHLGRSHD
jgi:hypothetical protein